MTNICTLGVNVDHVATLRESRKEHYPDPNKFAQLIIPLGISNITMHLREDRRHIQENDVELFLSQKLAPLNLEIGTQESMLKLALTYQPYSVCLVPENRQELTTEGGLDLMKVGEKIAPYIKELSQYSKIFAFIEPNVDQIDCAKSYNFDGIELHTGRFCNAYASSKTKLWEKELKDIYHAAHYAKNLNLTVDAGHGLTFKTTQLLLQTYTFDTLNIGHFLIAMSLYDGAKNTVQKMLDILNTTKINYDFIKQY